MCFPENDAIPFEYKNGRVYLKIEELQIHTVVEMID